MTVSDGEITEALALAEKATPGPWRVHHRDAMNRTNDPARGDEGCGLGWEFDQDAGPPEATLRGLFARGHDAAFIAAAREGWPRALRALQAEREARRSRAISFRCETHPDVVSERMWGCPDCLFELMRENKRLRGLK